MKSMEGSSYIKIFQYHLSKPANKVTKTMTIAILLSTHGNHVKENGQMLIEKSTWQPCLCCAKIILYKGT
jgi:hypothetical protein